MNKVHGGEVSAVTGGVPCQELKVGDGGMRSDEPSPPLPSPSRIYQRISAHLVSATTMACVARTMDVLDGEDDEARGWFRV